MKSYGCRRTVIMSPLSGTEKMSPPPPQDRSLLDNGGMRNSGDLKLPVKQARKVFVLECLRDGRMTNREAARSLELSVRQVQRLKRDFIRKGYDALRHGNTGRKPAHALKETC